ncbi:response regulator [Rhizobium sp. KVB221]|uniref:Response regulator n=1 Tax=Rhizobium setariae TaxID=2801340 RepID=A0A937CPZ0_9HYPH|nr:response regulator [Rhizobium setariae]MBL0375486.1 response regulator [Rhizobium setariae]
MDRLLSGKRALVVEDEMLILMMIEDMLRDLGCESVKAAATVSQALALLETQNFDVATLDMNLEGNDSYLVAEALRTRGVPFVFATGYGSPKIRDGFSDRPVLKKPFMDRELGEALARILAPQTEVNSGRIIGV